MGCTATDPFSLSFPRTRPLLDFSHLWTKGVVYVRHQSAQREVIEMRTLPTEMVQILSSFCVTVLEGSDSRAALARFSARPCFCSR
jgi:hypothetical protein